MAESDISSLQEQLKVDNDAQENTTNDEEEER